MGTIDRSPLGRATRYADRYDAGLLYAVDRAPQRHEIGLAGELPFVGTDRWTAWELAWLDVAGRPQVAIATFDVPCASPHIVESKSVKLWLASLSNERLASSDAVGELLSSALREATGATVAVALSTPEDWQVHARRDVSGTTLDGTLPSAFPDAPDASLLRVDSAGADETIVSHGFRSVCPVTGQPDCASLSIRTAGVRIERRALAAYLYGYRRHPGFHEHCVERIFVDLMRACAPRRLAVEARFTRRGGVDINPFRASDPGFGSHGAPGVRQ